MGTGLPRRLLAAVILAIAGGPLWAADSGTTLQIGGAKIEVHYQADRFAATPGQLTDWIAAAGDAVSRYYGRFPVTRLRIRVESRDGSRVMAGTTWGRENALIRMVVGNQANFGALRQDWMMTHEMVHLAFPPVGRRHAWIEEGLATYVEPIARAEAGQISVDEVWRQLVDGLPRGLPRPGDGGLDQTQTWGSTYWGGALFCLLADIQIRQQTGNRLGLRDALRAIVEAGGNRAAGWNLEQALRAGDRAVGKPVLMSLYRRLGFAPVSPDLDTLWRELGVSKRGGIMKYDDSAPLAAIRKAIAMPAKRQPTAGQPNATGPGGGANTAPRARHNSADEPQELVSSLGQSTEMSQHARRGHH